MMKSIFGIGPAPWGYGAFGIPYGKKIEDTDSSGVLGLYKLSLRPSGWFFVKLNMLC